MKLASFAPLAAALFAAGAVSAAEPFELGAEQMDTVTAGGTFTYNASALVDIDIALDKLVTVNSDIVSTVDAEGLTALANAFADAVGSEDAIVETDTFAQTDALSLIAQAGSTSLSAMVVNGGGGGIPVVPE